MNIPSSKHGLLALLINGTEKLRREIVEFLSHKPVPESSKSESNISESNISDSNVFPPNLKKADSVDDSVIDVSGQSYEIPRAESFEQADEPPAVPLSKITVPVWNHRYVYSYSEINDANGEQRAFYRLFRNSFLNEIYLDLEDNTNYAFILLFDLLNDYKSHRDLVKTESQLQVLGQFYPKTKPYAVSFLSRIMEAAGDYGGAARINSEYRNNHYDYWNLGDKYKKKLNLKKDEVKLLNKISYPGNNFCSIEFCCLEVIRYFLFMVRELNAKGETVETSLAAEVAAVADLAARKNFRYKYNSQNYHYCIESTTNDIYSNIFKYCENTVRDFYGHKRKLSTVNLNLGDKTEYETRIAGKVREIISASRWKFTELDEATEVELYSQNPTRWKIRFEGLKENYHGDTKQFVADVRRLGVLNTKNPSAENIFFEASKFISKTDQETALILYIYYLYYDLQSATFDNKQLTKTIQKSLFKTNEQLQEFQKIVSEFVEDRDLDKALRRVPEVYAVKRKKIQLDALAIEEVQHQHSGTVELLNEFLQTEEYEDEAGTIKAPEINNEEIEIKIVSKSENPVPSIYTDEVGLTPVQRDVLQLFAKNNFLILQSDLDLFAKSKGAFKTQLIDNLNETCYELLDDVLIEEENEYYAINESYYQNLLAK